MLKKLIRWLMGFQHRRKAMALVANYEEAQEEKDRTVWIGSYFFAQEEFLHSSALDGIYINKLPVSTVYVYYSLEGVKEQFNNFLYYLERNGAVGVTSLQEFQINSRSASIHEVFANDVPIKEQLLEINDILNKIIIAHEKQTSSMRNMNLSRLIPLFEMFAIIVNRVTLGYLATS